MAKIESKAVAAGKEAKEVVFSVGAASGDKVVEAVEAIMAGQTLPFMATLQHKGYKPLVVPSTGVNELIQGGAPVEFKVKSFDQAWVLVTDLAALAKRYEFVGEDFAKITVVQAPAEAVPAQSTSVSTGVAGEGDIA